MGKTGDAVLGCCIQNFNTAMPIAYDKVQASWWEDEADKKIWNELSCAYAFGGGIDVTLIKKKTDLNGRIDEICAAAATPLTISTYLTELEKDHKVSLWRNVASRIVDSSKSSTSAEELDESVMRLMMQAFEDDSAKDGTTSVKGAQKFEDWYKSPLEDQRWSHPFKRFGFYRPSNVLTISAYSGVGKSWLGLQYLEAACKEGASVDYYSLEMSEVELQARLIAMGSNVDTQQIEDRSVPFDTFAHRVKELSEYNYTVFTGATGPGRIFGGVRKAKASKRPLHVVIIDHIHLLDVAAKHSEYRLALDKFLNQLKGIAQDTNVCFILLAQLRKYGSEDKAPPKPTCAMLKETSALEQISDGVIFVHRDWSSGAWLDSGSIYFGKKRNGKMPGIVRVMLSKFGFRES